MLETNGSPKVFLVFSSRAHGAWGPREVAEIEVPKGLAPGGAGVPRKSKTSDKGYYILFQECAI